jgi:hypothetical protein
MQGKTELNPEPKDCAQTCISSEHSPSVAHWGCFIPDSGSKFFLSRIGIKDVKYCFYALGKYGPGCSSRIRIMIFYPSRIRILILNQSRILIFYPSRIRILIFYPSRIRILYLSQIQGSKRHRILDLTLGLVCLRGGGRRAAAVRPPPSSSSPQSDSDSE